MATSSDKDNKRQRRALRECESAPSFLVVRTIFPFVKEEVPLLPEWRAIWHRVREEVLRDHEAPENVVERIDDAVSRISSIADMTSVILKTESSVCILLGAGASAPEPSNIPTVAHLLPELWRRARKLGRDDIDRLATWCDDRKVSNIEDLLTAAYLANFAAKNSAVSGLLNYFLFSQREDSDAGVTRSWSRRSPTSSQVDAASVALFQETLQGLFGLLTSTMIPAPPNTGHQEIAKFVAAHPKTSVVTTNYDGCLDEAFLQGSVSLNTYIGGDVVPREGIDLIKIHGSINWSYCESCHEVKEFDLLSLKDGFENDTLSYAVVGICKNCGGQRRPLLIPPIGLKFIMFPNLIRLWNLARERIESADILLVVGFSFSEADSYINKIIERSMSVNSNQTMIVCDPNPKLVPILRDRYSARIADFRNDRILEAIGSSADLLPTVFEALLDPGTARKPSSKATK